VLVTAVVTVSVKEFVSERYGEVFISEMFAFLIYANK